MLKINRSYWFFFVQPICVVMLLQSTRIPPKNWQRSVHPLGRERKLHFPQVIPAQWNPGIVLVTAGFQSTLKCNWTRERQTEKERHCQGQSLAWHAIATSVLIDLYKATTTHRFPPPSPFCLIDLGYSLSKHWIDRTGCSSASSILFCNFHSSPRNSLSCPKSIQERVCHLIYWITIKYLQLHLTGMF